MDDLELISAFVAGMIAMAFAVAGLFFLRFWRDTRDRLFLIFALAFWLLGLARFGLIMAGDPDETKAAAFLYIMRLGAYLLILFAILDKNRPLPRKPKASEEGGGGEE